MSAQTAKSHGNRSPWRARRLPCSSPVNTGQPQRRAAVLAVLGAAVLFGTTGTAKELGPDSATALGVGAMRIVFGALTLWLIARRLPRLLAGIPSKLNLIPMNAHPDSPYRPPRSSRIDAFLRELAARDMTVTLRRSRGPDIQAACGQLALRGRTQLSA